MKEELEILKLKMDTAKINIELAFSKTFNLSSLYVAILIGFCIPIFFTFGFGALLMAFIPITLIVIYLFVGIKKEERRARRDFFIFGKLIRQKTKVDMKKLDKEIQEFREGLDNKKILGLFKNKIPNKK